MNTIRYLFSVICSFFYNLIHINYDDEPNERYYPDEINTYDLYYNKDVERFLYRFNDENDYTDIDGKTLNIGDIINIHDGVYNVPWRVTEFDSLHGWGIGLVPDGVLENVKFNKTSNVNNKGYLGASIDTEVIYNFENTMKSFFGKHLMKRDVKLSSSCNEDGYTNKCKWVTRYATILTRPQVGDLTYESLDCGEENYQLPLFKYKEYNRLEEFWIRELNGSFGEYDYALSTNNGVTYKSKRVNYESGFKPLIYIR